MDTVLHSSSGVEFYNSAKHIKGDTREKRRCNNKYDWVWQYMTIDDRDGVRMGQCIAIDTRELADLKERGVKYYKCYYTGGYVYKISLGEFEKWAVPVKNTNPIHGEQVCVSWRHWDDSESKYKKALAKPKKVKVVKPKRVKTWVNLSMFGG